MFTGIIQEIGTVVRMERSKGVRRLTIQVTRLASHVQRLESVAVNGVCLTVVNVRQGTLTFELIPETQRLTNLGSLRQGGRVNLEPSLTMTDRLNGHVVLGHIDGIGTILKRRQLSGELILEIRVAAGLRKLLVPKGPVTVDGVSLTVSQKLTPTTFAIQLIPETLRQTVLSSRTVGDRVNIELDYVAKLILEAVPRRERAVMGFRSVAY